MLYFFFFFLNATPMLMSKTPSCGTYLIVFPVLGELRLPRRVCFALHAVVPQHLCICQQFFCPPHAFPVFAVGYVVDVFCQYLVEHGNGLIVPAVQKQG